MPVRLYAATAYDAQHHGRRECAPCPTPREDLHARARHSAKRGGGFRRVDFKESLLVSSESDPQLLRIDEALNELAQFDSRKAQVVEMRYFGGLSAAEIASVLGISTQSVNRDWNLAKAWLARAMTRQERNERLTRRTPRELK